jgi:transposase
MHRLPVARHLTANQARAEYRACRHPVEKVRWHAIWLLLRADRPRTPARPAEAVGRSVVTVRDLLHRWSDCGPAGLTGRRASDRGRPRLSDDQRAEVFAAPEKRPPDGGLRSGPEVAAFVRDRWAVVVCPQTGWEWLKDLGFTPRVPRPRHPEAAGPAARRRRGKKPTGEAGPVEGEAPG